MKKILMLATYFPPGGGISTFRITKFVKFLPRFDWKPVVLTVDKVHYDEYDFPIDESLVKDLPDDLIIYRTKFGSKPTFIKSIRSALPTRWLSELFGSIGKIIAVEKPSIMYITGDPFFPLVIAPFVKRFYKLKYVIDLRDPWKLAIPDHPPKGFKGKLFTFLNNTLEPLVLNNAEKVIVVSQKMLEDYQKSYPKKNDNFFIVIPNGYDPDDYDYIPPIFNEEFTIVYAGKFLDGKSFRDPTPFLKAIKLLINEGINIKFKYIGKPHNLVDKIVAENDLSEYFETLGYLPYNQTVAHMKGANMLLLIGNGQETEQTGKIFDYFGCKRPILALASETGGIADVVNGVEYVELIANIDEVRIANAIQKYTKITDLEFINRSNISGYQRIGITEKLADILNSVTD